MEDIYAIRRKNLANLCRTKAEGNQSQLARELDLAPSLVNRYLNGKKKMGDEIPRSAEKRFQLPYGWMDNVHPSDREETLLKAYREANEPVKRSIEGAAGIHPTSNQDSSLDRDRSNSRNARY